MKNLEKNSKATLAAESLENVNGGTGFFEVKLDQTPIPEFCPECGERLWDPMNTRSQAPQNCPHCNRHIWGRPGYQNLK